MGGLGLGVKGLGVRGLLLLGTLILSGAQAPGCNNNLCNVTVTLETPAAAQDIFPKAGTTSKIVIDFFYALTVEENDRLEIYLPGFEAVNSNSLTHSPTVNSLADLSTTLRVWGVADWDPTTSILTLISGVPGETLAPNIPVKVTIGNGFLNIPVYGIVLNDPQYTAQYKNANAVPVESGFFALEGMQAVGVMYNTSLTYNPQLPNYPTQLKLNFTHSSKLQAGDNVLLDLDAFLLDTDPTAFTADLKVCSDRFLRSRSCSNGTVGGTASVDGTKVLINLNFADTIEELELVEVTVPSSANIRLPQQGTTQNAISLQIRTTAAAGPVPYQKIQATELVLSPKINYTPAKLGIGECSTHDEVTGACTEWVDEATDIEISFTTGVTIAINETLTFEFPGFTRSKQRGSLPGTSATLVDCTPSCDLGLTSVAGISASSVWGIRWTESTQQIHIDFKQQVVAWDLVSIVIPASAGISPPNTTQSENDVKFTFSTSSVSGIQVKGSPAVGGFITSGSSLIGTTSLALDSSARVGLPSALELSFALLGQFATSQCVIFCDTVAESPAEAHVKMDLLGPELVYLKLEGFKRSGGNLEHMETLNSKFSKASWADDRSTLILTASQAVSASEQITLSIPSSAGITLPAEGLTRNLAALKISTNAEDAPVQPTALSTVPAVGQIYNVQFGFEPRKAGVPTELTVSFTMRRRLDSREEVNLKVSSFFRPSGLAAELSATCQSGGAPFLIYPEWSAETSTIAMIIGAGGVPADQALVCVFGKSNQLHLREQGIAHLAKKPFWRVVNMGDVETSWFISQVALYSDSLCHNRIYPSNISKAFGSSGTGVGAQPACMAYEFANSSTGCPSGYRSATFSEIATCKETLCNADFYPDFLIADGYNASFMGRGYGCEVSEGQSHFPGSELICVPEVGSPSNVFDNSSASWWNSNPNFGGTLDQKSWVGLEFETSVSVQCMTLEQDHYHPNLNAQGVILQSSADGWTWVNVLRGSLNSGVSQVNSLAIGESTAYEELRLGSNAIRGPVVPTPFETQIPIGSFGPSTSLDFGNPVAGEVTSLIFEATPSMEMVPGEALILSLPSFLGPSAQTLNLTAYYYHPVNYETVNQFELRRSYGGRNSSSQGLGAECNASLAACPQPQEDDLFSASWSDEQKVLRIVLATTAYPGYPLKFEIHEDSGLQLPPQGIAPSACGTGPTTEPGVSIQPDGSSQPCGTCENCTGSNENELTLAAEAATGYVLFSSSKTVIRNANRVGILRNTAVSYKLLSSAYNNEITVNFTFNREFSEGDEVRLHLPGFWGDAYQGVVPTGPGSLYFKALAWDPVESVLTIFANTSCPSQTAISLVVPEALGVRLRVGGLELNDPTLKISVNADFGRVAPISIEKSPVVGSFTGDETRIEYIPSELKTDGTTYVEGRVAAISIGFTLNKRIQMGETVFLVLPGFSRASGDSQVPVADHNVSSLSLNFSTVDTNGVFSSFISGSWTESAERLSLTASKMVPANQRHVVLIKSQAGIRLPTGGLVENDPRLTIGTDAVLGPNTGTPIARSSKLFEVCGAECAAWELECSANCRCGHCAP